VLLGRCVDVWDGELAYAPIAGALRSLAAPVDDAERVVEILHADGQPRRAAGLVTSAT
jgi:hypothetical protein